MLYINDGMAPCSRNGMKDSLNDVCVQNSISVFASD